MDPFNEDIGQFPIIIQEALRMVTPNDLEVSLELAKEDAQRVLGASLEAIDKASSILCMSYGINPKSAIGKAIMVSARTALICGARTAQRLNGNEVLK